MTQMPVGDGCGRTLVGMDTRRPSSRAFVPPPSARRHAALESLSAWLDIGLSALAVIAVVLLVLELSGTLSEPWSSRVVDAQFGVWGIFFAAFVVELVVAPSKSRYLREHWVVVLSLAVPALRILRVFRAVRVLQAGRVVRPLHLVRIFGSLNRATGAARRFLQYSQFGVLLATTAIMTATLAAAGQYFEAGNPTTEITSYWQALWWAITLVTTVNTGIEAQTAEARVVSLALRVLGVAVIGYLTARVAAYLLGSQREGREGEPATEDIAALRREIADLRDELRRTAERTSEPPR